MYLTKIFLEKIEPKYQFTENGDDYIFIINDDKYIVSVNEYGDMHLSKEGYGLQTVTNHQIIFDVLTLFVNTI